MNYEKLKEEIQNFAEKHSLSTDDVKEFAFEAINIAMER